MKPALCGASLETFHQLLDRPTPIRGDSFRARCPVHAGSSQSLVVTERDGRVLLHCHAGCATGDILAALGLELRDLFADAARVSPGIRPVARAHAPPPPDPQKVALALRLWAERRPLRGSIAERYLQGRGLGLPPPDGDLAFHPDVRACGIHGPAMIGRVSRATDAGHTLGLHLTALHAEGERVVRGERRYLAAKAGGVIRLHPDECVTYGLAVGEGIESTLALHDMTRVPAWAAMDAGNLARLPVLAGIDHLHVGVDRDPSGTGQRAAIEIMTRWRAAGIDCTAWVPSEIGLDMADIVEVAA
jgi:putative DNA primase/helicase